MNPEQLRQRRRERDSKRMEAIAFHAHLFAMFGNPMELQHVYPKPPTLMQKMKRFLTRLL